MTDEYIEGVWVWPGGTDGEPVWINEDEFKQGKIVSFDSGSISIDLQTGCRVLVTCVNDDLHFEIIDKRGSK